MKELLKKSKYLSVVFKTNGEHSDWFGYYNYDTLNGDQTRILCNRAPVDGIAPEKGMSIELGFYDVASGEWHHLDDSDSWNWQQGSMLQWLPGKGNENKVIYNRSENNHLVSRIRDINTGEIKDIKWAIYGITPDGKHSIALDLERSYWCRAYHYQSVANKEREGRIVDGDGIYDIDLVSNTRRCIVKIQDIIALEPRPNFPTLKHWVEHIMINKEGTKFCFLHRFSPEFNVNAYQTRLLIADIDGSNLQVIPGWDKVDWSHFGWGKDSFSMYTVYNNKLGTSYKDLGQSATKKVTPKQLLFKLIAKLVKITPVSIRKKLKGGKQYYQYYTCDSNGNYLLKEIFNQSYFGIDGHPSFTEDGRYMITDSYPDSNQYQRLIIFDTVTKKGLIVAELFAHYFGNPASCDLHPKLCKNNNYVAVDSAYNEKHHLILFKIDWDKVKKQIS